MRRVTDRLFYYLVALIGFVCRCNLIKADTIIIGRELLILSDAKNLSVMQKINRKFLVAVTSTVRFSRPDYQ
jgi:hypothetical protein